MQKRKDKDFIITYRGKDSYVVLGWIRANSLESAKKKIKEELKDKAKERFVSGAQVGEWKGCGPIFFR